MFNTGHRKSYVYYSSKSVLAVYHCDCINVITLIYLLKNIFLICFLLVVSINGGQPTD